MRPVLESIIIPCLPGDGIGSEITAAMQRVIDQAVKRAYQDQRYIQWQEHAAGQASFQANGEWLPEATINALKTHHIGIKGPLTTPIGEGFRSLNVQLRQTLDLYVCLRPVRWYGGLPSPHRDPHGIDITIFRENTEDIYTGIEYQPGTPAHQTWMQSMQSVLPDDYSRIPHVEECGIGIKPISKIGSQRLMRAALQWSLEHHRQRLTIVHKGNIMKFTEGAFRTWAYDLSEDEFADQVFTLCQFNRIRSESGQEKAESEKRNALDKGRLWVDDVIADVAFEQLITRPQQFDVIATTNLNGDYLSDTFAALVGGIGVSPGANINYEQGWGLFEANHGSAEDIAGLDKANPSSLILSGAMMFDFLGWHEVAALMRKGVEKTIQSGNVTFDLHAQLPGSTLASTSQFCTLVMENMK